LSFKLDVGAQDANAKFLMIMISDPYFCKGTVEFWSDYGKLSFLLSTLHVSRQTATKYATFKLNETILQSKIEKVNGEEENDNNDESGLQFIKSDNM